MASSIISLAYLLAAVLFITGLRFLSHPRTAVRGNTLGATGMFLAVVVTLFSQQIIGFEVIIAGVIVGALIGVAVAVRVAMTAMPQLVALFNGFGGGASALVAGGALAEIIARDETPGIQVSAASGLSGLIGAVTLLGSLVAFSKLQGLTSDKPLLLPGRHALNVLLAAGSVGLLVWLVLEPSTTMPFWVLAGVASVLGITLVMAIGGADMPVVISLLNSYSGLAAAATGFVLKNDMLIIAGSLVGAAGFILTMIMSRAMNRSLPNILFGGLGAVSVSRQQAEGVYEGVKSTSPEEVAMLMDGTQRVIVVPGYGMAVAQAQYAVRDLVNALEKRGIDVSFAIHPVAGRMPGHMNVLLAEVDVPYEKLVEMDQINPMFQQTDLVYVVGANDVINPEARKADPAIPIAGMPILNADQARSVVIVKRSLSPGFAGIPNPLFAAGNAMMLFGDARQMTQDVVQALQEV